MLNILQYITRKRARKFLVNVIVIYVRLKKANEPQNCRRQFSHLTSCALNAIP